MSAGAGLAAAFFRLYILYALERAPARPAAILAFLHSREGALPFESGAFSRALQQLLDAGLLVPADAGAVALTPMGRREREAQRAVWARVVTLVARLLEGELPDLEPPTGGGMASAALPPERVSERYRERVVLAEIREAGRRARESGGRLGVALAEVSVAHPQPVRARQMVQRCLRETLGTARSTFARGASALRCGPSGVCLVVRDADADTQAELLRARLMESLGAMSAGVASFAPARYDVRVGSATWTSDDVASADLLRRAERALAGEEAARVA